ncbi:hypothetical protein DH2020_041140 [Rehmannia glutinosa]|uniref:Uncharacterized protein n=1 Tax=Rehmannia glutinosa TaxID=99300 RepID=A0ABR0USI5_REHGL
MEHDQAYTCKIDLKPWHFWAKKGYKSLVVDGNQMDAYWDLRSAKFSGGSPEPCSDFYVALVSEEEIVLLLGDWKKKAYKRTKSRPALVDALMFYKKEHVFGKKSFSIRAKFDQKKREHDIVVESSTVGPREPEIRYKCSGDVHAWLFCAPGSSHGLFIFKPGEADSDVEDDDNRGDDSDCSGPSKYYSTQSYSKASQFCLFLYAWKIE